jgi:hypothetical protein
MLCYVMMASVENHRSRGGGGRGSLGSGSDGWMCIRGVCVGR